MGLRYFHKNHSERLEMSMEFEWNQDKAALNLEKHRISFQEAATIFSDSLSITFPDPDHSIGESRYVIIGISSFGQLLVVAHTE